MTFKKYPKIERLGSDDNREILLFGEDTIVIEEKVDGGNGSYWIDKKGVLHEGSRNRDLTSETDEKSFIKQRIYLRELLKDKKLHPDYVYYLEWMQKHTITYTNSPEIIGLDIRLKHQANSEGFGMFLGRDVREQEFNRLGIENVPLVWRGKVKDLKKLEIDKIIPQSKYYKGKAEGIVIKNFCRKHPRDNHQLYAKIVTDEFKENNKAVFGGIRQQNTDTSKILDQYFTEARIRKAILKFTKEDGLPLENELMKVLPNYVIKDVLKEEFCEIYESYKFLDFKELRSKVPKICFKILQEEKIKQDKLNYKH